MPVKRRSLSWSLGSCLVIIALLGAGWWQRPSDQRRWRQWHQLPLARTVDDPASNAAELIDWAGARDFRFAMGDGSGWHGYNVLQIDGEGRCTYTFVELVAATDSRNTAASAQQWRRATFVLDAATLRNFRKLLRDVDFFRLKKEYHADIEDGTQRWARVEASGHRKTVYCSNFFPPAFLRISRFVSERIVATQGEAITAAETINPQPKDLELE